MLRQGKKAHKLLLRNKKKSNSKMQWSLKLFMVDSLLGKNLIIMYVKTFWTYKKIKSLQKGGSFGIMTHSLKMHCESDLSLGLIF